MKPKFSYEVCLICNGCSEMIDSFSHVSVRDAKTDTITQAKREEWNTELGLCAACEVKRKKNVKP